MAKLLTYPARCPFCGHGFIVQGTDIDPQPAGIYGRCFYCFEEKDMGLVHRGIPELMARQYASRYDLTTFIETGTLVGRTAAWAAGYFEKVITIELDATLAARARERLKTYNNVTLSQADSRVMVPALAAQRTRCLWWLDAHWSRDLGYQRPADGECPLLTELEAIHQAKGRHVVLIDDARLFNEPPPKPHRAEDWPTRAQIEEALRGWAVTEKDDVLIAIPLNIDTR